SGARRAARRHGGHPAHRLVRTVEGCSMKRTGSIGWWLTAGAGIAAGVYGTYVGVAWSRFGRTSVPDPEDTDVLLDRFMPVHDIAERHRIHVAAPAAVTLTAARELDLFNLP